MYPLFSLAINSVKEIIRQPFYYIILITGSLLMLVSFSFTFFAFGDELKMIRNMGISNITICGLLIACLSSSVLIKREFESQATLSMLSKPITKTHYILGKYLGILTAATLMIFLQFVVLEIALIIRKFMEITNYTTFTTNIIDIVCLFGICFAIFQIAIITSISLIISLYLNTTANITICLLFFIFCNTYSYILPFEINAHKPISLITYMAYALFPDFQNLNVFILDENIINNNSFWDKQKYIQYIVYIIAYHTIYSFAVLLISVFLFKRKEII